ncbi:helix-turn-helix domain-containing protein [Thiosulfatimonas sediminis]|uniref:helix-turn-helix domain-containing protein n=1 Tax=Thiosulfatimonas sediminis TaxID=2675054 RepID=UPI001565AB68|nr:helix-turn-helix transcriptional regulator [Thiosulfatimonas sediminis]
MSSEDLRPAILLRAARNIFNMSLKELGQQVDVSAVAVGKWENGDAMIKASTFNALQKFFRENGIKLSTDQEGEAVIYVTQEAIDRVTQNPKKPKIKTLLEIYRDEKRPRPHIEAYDLESVLSVELEKQVERDPDFLKHLLEQAGRDDYDRQHPLSLFADALLSVHRTKNLFSIDIDAEIKEQLKKVDDQAD